MLSGKSIHPIEVHREQTASSVILEIHFHPGLTHMRKLPDVDLRERTQRIPENLGTSLDGSQEMELARN